jgi:hypothetical protein
MLCNEPSEKVYTARSPKAGMTRLQSAFIRVTAFRLSRHASHECN